MTTPPSSAASAPDPPTVPVTADNFVRAETDMYVASALSDAGGLGIFFHYRAPMAIDKQTVVRANRDTLYSSAVVDLAAGSVTITLPDPGDRFMSMQVIDEDRYAFTVYAPGRFRYGKDEIGTRYALLALRTFVDPDDPDDLPRVHALQDAATIAPPGGPGQFDAPNWDPVSQKTVREALLVLNATLPDLRHAFGRKADVDPIRHFIATAAAWGGNPDQDAVYLNVTPPHNDGTTIYQLTVPAVVPVDGFWSITVYNAAGYLAPNPANVYSLNSSSVRKRDDGTATIQFGGCDRQTPNCLPTPPGWNYMVRLYRPRPSGERGTRRMLPFATRQGVRAMPGTTPPDVSPDDARAIAKDASIYGFPIVDNYRILYAYFVNQADPEYKAPWNTLANTARVYTPADVAVQTPNSDTPYSFVGADLRAEPLVLTVPKIEEGRYYSLQFIDLYTFTFAYVGSRTTGNGGGNYLLAGPGWSGAKPDGIDAVIACDTEFALILYRTQLFNPDDLDHVKQIQAAYQAQPLSAFLGKPAPAPAPAIDFLPPVSADDERNSLTFFDELDFLLQFCPVVPSEVALRQRFSTLGIAAGQTFDSATLAPDIRQAVQDGMADAWSALESVRKEIDAGKVSTGDLFGTREHLQNNYLYRMAGAPLGIYGNSKEEALYPPYAVDADGQPLDGAKHNYTLRFAPGKLPPVNAFWSVTMYTFPASLLSANPIDRYLINSSMLPNLVKDPDGGVTLSIQHASPGAAQEPNWLPAPAGSFALVMRLYWPKPAALDGTWTAPPLARVS